MEICNIAINRASRSWVAGYGTVLPKYIYTVRCFALVGSLLYAGGVACSAELERIPAGEDAAINSIVSLALAELQKRYPDGAAVVRRDAHAKAHACVKATFKVDEGLESDLQVGVASNPGRQYKAWVRFSNGAFEPGADTGYDGRGMALKLMGNDQNARSDWLDILMINYPVFFSGDALDYLDFAKAGALTGNSEGLRKYFVPGWNPFEWKVRQALIAYRIANQQVASPLLIQYYSMVPFQFGDGRAVKYSAKPCQGENGTALSGDKGPNFLKEAMAGYLEHHPACFEVMVQERKDSMPIEDATIEWDRNVSPFRRIGILSIPSQNFDYLQRMEFCENLSFSPWNAPSVHKPLGGINRIRGRLYEEISAYRHSRNRAPVPDALAEWDKP